MNQILTLAVQYMRAIPVDFFLSTLLCIGYFPGIGESTATERQQIATVVIFGAAQSV